MRSISAASLRRHVPAMWSLGSRILGGVSVLLVNVALARRLGPADFGTVAVVTSVSMFGALIVCGGTSRVLLRSIAGSLGTDSEHLIDIDLAIARRVLLVTLPMGALVTFLMSAYFIRRAEDAWSASLAGAFVAIGAGLMFYMADVLRGLGEVRLANLGAGRNGGALATGLFMVLLLVTGNDLLSSTGALGLNIVALIVSLAASLLVYRRFRPQFPTRSDAVDRSVQRLFIISSMTFLGTQLAMYVASQIDLWVGSSNLPEASVGVYAAALRLMGMVSMPLVAAQLMFSAPIARLWAQRNPAELEVMVRRTVTVIAVPSLVILVPCVLFPGEILSLLYGKRYSTGGFVLAVLALAQIVNVLTGLCGTVLGMCGKESLLLRTALLWSVLSLVFDLLGVRLFGIRGLAVASALTSSGQFLMLWLIARMTLRIWTHPGWPARLPKD